MSRSALIDSDLGLVTGGWCVCLSVRPCVTKQYLLETNDWRITQFQSPCSTRTLFLRPSFIPPRQQHSEGFKRDWGGYTNGENTDFQPINHYIGNENEPCINRHVVTMKPNRKSVLISMTLNEV